jgi:hypothetical protein
MYKLLGGRKTDTDKIYIIRAEMMYQSYYAYTQMLEVFRIFILHGNYKY